MCNEILNYAQLIINENLITELSDDAYVVWNELSELNIPDTLKEESFDMAKELMIKSGKFVTNIIHIKETTVNTNNILSLIYESAASEKAKAKGLVHLGFGLWGKKKGGSPMFKSQKGKLVSVSAGDLKKSDDDEKDDNDKPKKKKKSTDKADDKSIKKGIHDIKRISGKNYQFSYTFDGRNKTILLTKDEIDRLINKSDTIKYIIQTRLDKLKKQKQFGKDLVHLKQNKKNVNGKSNKKNK